MRSLAILVAAILLLPLAAPGQSLMRLYRMAYSIGGSYSNGSTDTELKTVGGTSRSEIRQETVRLSMRNAYFVTRNAALGLELSWEQGRGESRPEPNPINYREIVFDRTLYAGPLFRWYQPITFRWFLSPEVSVGYLHYLGEYEESSAVTSVLPATTSARGVGLRAGAGIGYFLTRNVVVDLSIRYSHGWVSGEYQVPGQADLDIDISGGEIGGLFGFQFLF